MQVRDVMTRKVICVTVGDSILAAAGLMLQNRISGLPVLDKDGELTGIVTEGDFLRRSELGTQRRRSRWLEFIAGPGKLAEDYVQASGRKVEEIMTPDPCVVSEDDAPPRQAASGGARGPHGRHRQPRQSDARAGELGP